MIEEIKNHSNWYLIIIFDPEALPGKNIVNMIQLLLNAIRFRFIIFNDIQGAVISALKEEENISIELDDFLRVGKNVVQFEWGNFFLFKEYPKYWINDDKIFYPNIISKTDTTIRAVDNTYIYIYTPYKDVVKIIQSHYEIESIKIDILEKLDYPE